MVEMEFVADDFSQFIEFVKNEFHGKYRYLDIGLNSIYAYVLGAPERLSYREEFDDGKNAKNDMTTKIEELKKQGFLSGYRKAIG